MRSSIQIAVLAFAIAASEAIASDRSQWGEAWSRNQTSPELGLPEKFDPESGENIQWSAALGSEAHSTPVIAGGRVFVGTNNNDPRDPRHVGDRGVLMCFDEKDGRLLWQLVVPKLDEDRYFDWPKSGISSPATVEGDRVYIVSNRAEVLCLDVRGLANGNDGPFTDEAAHQTPAGEPLIEARENEGDIIWRTDLRTAAGIWPHDGAHSSVLIRGDHLYLNTGTGVDSSHVKIRTPDAPSLIVINKKTGRLLARDDEGIAPRIFHCTWSPPSMGRVGGKELIFFAGGDGIVRAFEPLSENPPEGEVAKLKVVWRYDLDPDAPKENVHRFNRNTKVGPSNIFGLPVFADGRIYLAGGGDIWWGKLGAWLKCVDAADGREIWSYALGKHVMASPAVKDGLVFIADIGRTLHCVDAKTGEAIWTHGAKGDFWASPFVVDGKVYAATRKGEVFVFAASREKKLLHEVNFGAPISATPVAANGALFIATMKRLFAITADPNDFERIKRLINAAEADQIVAAYYAAQNAISKFHPKSAEQRAERLSACAKFMEVAERRLEADRHHLRKKPVVNVALPIGVGIGIAGMAPESVADPVLRKEYETALAENSRNAEYWMARGAIERMRNAIVNLFAMEAYGAIRKEEDAAEKVTRLLAAESVPPAVVHQVLEKYKEWESRSKR